MASSRIVIGVFFGYRRATALIFGVFAFLGDFSPKPSAHVLSHSICWSREPGRDQFWLALGVAVIVWFTRSSLNVCAGRARKEMRLHPVNILFFKASRPANCLGCWAFLLPVHAAGRVQIVIDAILFANAQPDPHALDRGSKRRSWKEEVKMAIRLSTLGGTLAFNSRYVSLVRWLL